MGASWLEPLTFTVTVFPFRSAHWPCKPWAVFVYEHFCEPVGWLTIFPPLFVKRLGVGTATASRWSH